VNAARAHRPEPARTHTASPAAGRADATWQRLIRVAAELFARNGYHATGIAELCAEARLSRGSLYYYIDSKETLLYEISRTQVGRLNAQAAKIVALDLPAPERLRLLARSLMRNISDHLAEWTVFFKEFGAFAGPRRAEIIEARDTFESYWLRVLGDGVAEGAFRHTSPLLVKGILGMFNYTYLWLRPGGRLAAEDLADEFVDVLLSGLGAPGRPGDGTARDDGTGAAPGPAAG
jgi:AcrR family transcriptional regulator